MITRGTIKRIFSRDDNGFSSGDTTPVAVNVPAKNISYSDKGLRVEMSFNKDIENGMLLELDEVLYRIVEIRKEKQLHFFFLNLKCEQI